MGAEYAAGLFDGEGSVIINRNGANSGTYSLCCTMHLTHHDTLAALHATFGGSLNTVKRTVARRQMWSWRVTGPAAVAFLQAVQPFLRIKSEQAAIGLAFRAQLRDARPMDAAARAQEFQRRAAWKLRMQAANAAPGG